MPGLSRKSVTSDLSTRFWERGKFDCLIAFWTGVPLTLRHVATRESSTLTSLRTAAASSSVRVSRKTGTLSFLGSVFNFVVTSASSSVLAR
jgi:hypothetical protein